MTLLEPNKTVIQIIKGIFSKKLIPDNDKQVPAFVAEVQKAIDLLERIDSVIAQVAANDLDIALNYYNTKNGQRDMRDKNYLPISGLLVDVESLMDGQWQNDRLTKPSLLKQRDAMGIPSAREQKRFESLVATMRERFGDDLMKRTDFASKWEYATVALDEGGRDAFLTTLENFSGRA